jgi:hypothetical protein
MSLLKTIDPATNAVTDTAAPAVDHKAAFREAIQRVEDAYTVGVKTAEDRAVAAESALASLRKEHETLAAAHAEAQKKLAVLKDLKAKLEGL